MVTPKCLNLLNAGFQQNDLILRDRQQTLATLRVEPHQTVILLPGHQAYTVRWDGPATVRLYNAVGVSIAELVFGRKLEYMGKLLKVVPQRFQERTFTLQEQGRKIATFAPQNIELYVEQIDMGFLLFLAYVMREKHDVANTIQWLDL